VAAAVELQIIPDLQVIIMAVLEVLEEAVVLDHLQVQEELQLKLQAQVTQDMEIQERLLLVLATTVAVAVAVELVVQLKQANLQEEVVMEAQEDLQVFLAHLLFMQVVAVEVIMNLHLVQQGQQEVQVVVVEVITVEILIMFLIRQV
jgi:hypothetical protein